jgi:hypothetical protein
MQANHQELRQLLASPSRLHRAADVQCGVVAREQKFDPDCRQDEAYNTLQTRKISEIQATQRK